MFDANKIIAALQTELPKVLAAVKTEGTTAVDSVKAGGNAQTVALGAGAAGLLGGLLLSRGGKFGRQLGTLGGLAALGTLAYNAWQKHQGAQAAGGAAPSDSGFLPAPEDETTGKNILRAMIAATKADGVIDAEEKAKLFERLGALDLSAEEKAFVFDEMNKPLNLDEVVAPVTTREQALQIYAASLAAMVPDQPAEKAYLATLAQRLHLDPELVATLHAEALQPA